MSNEMTILKKNTKKLKNFTTIPNKFGYEYITITGYCISDQKYFVQIYISSRKKNVEIDEIKFKNYNIRGIFLTNGIKFKDDTYKVGGVVIFKSEKSAPFNTINYDKYLLESLVKNNYDVQSSIINSIYDVGYFSTIDVKNCKLKNYKTLEFKFN